MRITMTTMTTVDMPASDYVGELYAMLYKAYMDCAIRGKPPYMLRRDSLGNYCMRPTIMKLCDSDSLWSYAGVICPAMDARLNDKLKGEGITFWNWEGLQAALSP